MRVFRNRQHSLRELMVSAREHGDAEYLVSGDRRWTFAEHHRAVASLARTLRERYGIEHGDRVVILSANNAEWILSFWAISVLGAITVGMNALWSGGEIAYGISDSAPRLVIADAKRRELLGQTHIPVLSIENDVPELTREYSDTPLPESPVDEDDPAVILYTSGTSGRPKGAVHSHRNVLAAKDFHLFNDALATELGRPPQRRRFLLAAPLFHIAALHNLAVPRLAVGDTAVIHTERFEAGPLLRLIERERVTNWGAVPTLAQRIVEHDDLAAYDLSSLATMSLNSAPSSPTLIESVRRALPHVAASLGTSYGQTETATGVTLASGADLAEDPNSVGRPVINVDIEIRDTEGHGVPDGVEGEICVRGAQVMLGYWNKPEKTRGAIDADGWLHSGDLGTMWNGQLRISSRRSDLILRGGENVYPVEIEEVLAEHPAVRESVVVGIPHHDLGEDVAAVVVTDADPATTEAELTNFVAGRLARFKVPAHWQLTTAALPRNALGKIERYTVRACVVSTLTDNDGTEEVAGRRGSR